MPVTEKWAYLDHAAVGPLSRPAADALRTYAAQAETEGDTVWPQWARRVETLRGQFAELVGTASEEICLVPNTSTGISLVAEGFPWKPGDSVVIPDGEFPSNLFPWQNQGSRGVQLRVVPRRDGRVLADDLFAHVDDSTRLIALSWVGYGSGFRADLDEIVRRAHARGILVFVDAIQGLGVFDLDLGHTDVDFLAADGHKWMLGPEGLGVAVIRKRHLDTLRCATVGWNSVRNTFNYAQPEFTLRPSAARFEPGSANMPGSAALSASLGIILAIRRAHGPKAIGDRVVSLASGLTDRLAAIGVSTRMPDADAQRSGIVTFEVPDRDPAEVRRRALDQGCVVSCRDGGVRAGIHAYNDSSDLQRLVDAVASTPTESSPGRSP
ncbi:aminotransferase class V-fold PLP-dependent enzyme [Roseiconus nitratireducens]|uniref:Aminotransferase class V-fold PLP-dependent enzyme n=2 Tax=Roseiconus nitratireducens TaxID=2605748 RepID=A0A5M6DJC9_9BACT|nr:aminotransferase class V-fold PLP-dependent enzyme [Roseiconus nitratireducens]